MLYATRALAQLDGFAQSFVGQQNWEGSVIFPVSEARDSDAAMGSNAGMIGAAAAAAAAAAEAGAAGAAAGAGSAARGGGGGAAASTLPMPKSSAAPAKAAAAAAAAAEAAKPTVPGKLHGAAPSYGIAGADDGTRGTDAGSDGDGGGSGSSAAAAAAAAASAAAAALPPHDTTFLVERSIASAVRQVCPLLLATDYRLALLSRSSTDCRLTSLLVALASAFCQGYRMLESDIELGYKIGEGNYGTVYVRSLLATY